MREGYSALTLEHFRQPRHVGVLPVAADVVRAQAGDVAQNAMFLFSLRLAQGRVDAVGWQAYGCPHVIAAASLTSEWLLGRMGAQIVEFDWRNILQKLDIPEDKAGRLLLLEDALRALAAMAGALSSASAGSHLIPGAGPLT